MTKTRKTITIDDNLAKIVDERDEFNLSGFVNAALQEHFAASSASSPQAAALRAELDEIERELSEVHEQQERLRERRQEIEEQLDDLDDNEPELLDQARDALTGCPRDPDNPAIQNWAGKLGVASEELIDLLEEAEA